MNLRLAGALKPKLFSSGGSKTVQFSSVQSLNYSALLCSPPLQVCSLARSSAICACCFFQPASQLFFQPARRTRIVLQSSSTGSQMPELPTSASVVHFSARSLAHLVALSLTQMHHLLFTSKTNTNTHDQIAHTHTNTHTPNPNSTSQKVCKQQPVGPRIIFLFLLLSSSSNPATKTT